MARAKRVVKEETDVIVIESKVRPREEIEEEVSAIRGRDPASRLQSIIIELLLDIRDKG